MIDQLTKALFEHQTIDTLIKCIKDDTRISSVELFDLDFRLYKNKKGLYNLEVLIFDDKGAYFKPIGYYEIIKKGWFSRNKITLTILREFELSFEKNNFYNNRIFEVKFLDIQSNGLIAGCSFEIINSLQRSFSTRQDQFLISNGLNLELIIALDGNPQLYLDDRYGIEGALIVYVNNNNGLGINPAIKYTSKFKELEQLELFTAFKRI